MKPQQHHEDLSEDGLLSHAGAGTERESVDAGEMLMEPPFLATGEAEITQETPDGLGASRPHANSLSPLSHCPKVEAHLLRLLHLGARPEPRTGVGGGEDVVDAEFDGPVRVLPQGCGAGGGRWLGGKARGRGGPGGLRLTRGPLGRPGARPSRPLALGATPPAPAPEVAVFEEVQQGLAAARERPVMALALLVALGSRHLRERQGLSGAGSGGAPAPPLGSLRPWGELGTGPCPRVGGDRPVC